MIKPEQLLEMYPHCKQAVVFTEFIICVPPDNEDESSWDLMVNTKTPMSLDEIVNMIRGVIQDEVEEQTKGRWKEAMEQTYHPTYRTYIAAKIGMM